MTRGLERFASLAARAALISTLGLPAACATHAGVKPQTPAPGAIQPAAVTDATFAPDVAELLKTRGQSPTRTSRLAGVVRYQLERARMLFDSGHEDAAVEAVQGALYLVRAGEFDDSMLQGRTAPLLEAANAVARNGHEGRALALYSMLARTLPQSAERKEVEAHLDAIRQWEQSTRSRGPLQAAGSDQRSAVERALWDPSHDTLRAARAATLEWLARAIAFSKEQGPPSDDFERDEAIEAYRAIRTGAMSLAALYLRNGNPMGALEAMEDPNIARVVSPHLHEALRRAAEEDDPEAWEELFSTFDRLASVEADVSVDPELAQAAAWGAAVELYRVEPKTLRGVQPLSVLLMRHGMAEVAPILLAPVVEASTRTEVLSWSLGYVLEALMNHDALGDLGAARRTFQHAGPLLAAIEHKPFAKEVTPSVARVEFAMGALEARAGDLVAARPLVERSAKSEPSLAALELLAAIDRQRGAARDALASLDSVTKLATESSDPSSVADAKLSMFEVYRDMGDATEAAKSLDGALRRALDARGLAHTGAEQANAERILARVLEEYGSLDAARRATKRAYEASRNDLRQLTATVLDAGRRGLTHGDLRSARDAARRGIEANVGADDLVYVALWLRLVERRLGVSSDGTVEEALATIDDDSGWPAKLRAWCTGRLTDEQLYASARTRVEQTEATFYAAMSAYVANDARALDRLGEVAKSEAIELVEVSMARELVADAKPMTLKLPSDVEIP
jgi:tetratricopeptide (TPR) repeat protein